MRRKSISLPKNQQPKPSVITLQHYDYNRMPPSSHSMSGPEPHFQSQYSSLFGDPVPPLPEDYIDPFGGGGNIYDNVGSRLSYTSSMGGNILEYPKVKTPLNPPAIQILPDSGSSSENKLPSVFERISEERSLPPEEESSPEEQQAPPLERSFSNESFSSNEWYRPSSSYVEFSKIPHLRPSSKNIISMKQDEMQANSPLASLINDSNGSSSVEEPIFGQTYNVTTAKNQLLPEIRPEIKEDTLDVDEEIRSRRSTSPIVPTEAITTGGEFRVNPPRSHKKSSFTIISEKSPQSSRATSPSRFSPFLGHGFKDPIEELMKPIAAPRPSVTSSHLKLPPINTTSDDSPRPSVQFDMTSSSNQSPKKELSSNGDKPRGILHENKTNLPEIMLSHRRRSTDSSMLPEPSSIQRDSLTSDLSPSRASTGNVKAHRALVINPNPTRAQRGLLRVISSTDTSGYISKIPILSHWNSMDDISMKTPKLLLTPLKTRRRSSSTSERKSSTTISDRKSSNISSITTSDFSYRRPSLSPARHTQSSRRKSVLVTADLKAGMMKSNRPKSSHLLKPMKSQRKVAKPTPLSPIIGTPNKDPPESPRKTSSKESSPMKGSPIPSRSHSRASVSFPPVSRPNSRADSRSMKSRSPKGSPSKSPQRSPSKSPRRQSESPRRQSVSPRRQSVSPKRQSVSPRRQSMSPRRQSISPRRSSISPVRSAKPLSNTVSRSTSRLDSRSNSRLESISTSRLPSRSNSRLDSRSNSRIDSMRTSQLGSRSPSRLDSRSSSRATRLSSKQPPKKVLRLQRSQTSPRLQQYRKDTKSSTYKGQSPSPMRNNRKKSISPTKKKEDPRSSRSKIPLSQRRMSRSASPPKTTKKPASSPSPKRSASILKKPTSSSAKPKETLTKKSSSKKLISAPSQKKLVEKRPVDKPVSRADSKKQVGKVEKSSSKTSLKSEKPKSEKPLKKVPSKTDLKREPSKTSLKSSSSKASLLTKRTESNLSTKLEKILSVDEDIQTSITATIAELNEIKALEESQKSNPESMKALETRKQDVTNKLLALTKSSPGKYSLGGEDIALPSAILEKSQKTLENIQKTVTEATDEIHKTIKENLTDLKTLENEVRAGSPTLTDGHKGVKPAASPAAPTQPIEASVSVKNHLTLPNTSDSNVSHEVTKVDGHAPPERVSERAVSALPEQECESANLQSEEDLDVTKTPHTVTIKEDEGTEDGVEIAGSEASTVSAARANDKTAKMGDGSGSQEFLKISDEDTELEQKANKRCCNCSRLCLPCRRCCKSKCCRKRPSSSGSTEPVLQEEIVDEKVSCWKKMNCCKKKRKPHEQLEPPPTVLDPLGDAPLEAGPLPEPVEVKQNKCCACLKRVFCCRPKNKIQEASQAQRSVSDDEDEAATKSSCFPCRKKKKVADTHSEIQPAWQSEGEPPILEDGEVPSVKRGCCGRCWDRLLCRKPKPVVDARRQSIKPAPIEETRKKIHNDLVEYNSKMKGAIPVMPLYLAWFCAICNTLVPGTGTILSGFFCICVGIPRFSQFDSAKARFGSLIVNCIVGVSQMFCVLFCLVGWGWSIWWGLIMLKTARKLKKIRKIEKLEKEEEKRQRAVELAAEAAAKAATNTTTTTPITNAAVVDKDKDVEAATSST
ncbi:hypothetical protein ACFFRR_008249 [Megaselia abdita]